MVLIKGWFSLLLLALLLSACQIGYIAESAYYQADLLRRRVPIDYALKNLELTQEQKSKLELAVEVRQFMKKELGLEIDSNYTTYVHLDRDYVTYVVSAAPKDELKQYTWSFPIIGSVPYKGYFKKESAEDEQRKLASKNLDTHLRGVSAYSTLGWFEDPLLSTMLNYKEHQFVSTLIHETVHANLYINGKSKFNETVATFLGQLGAETFYRKQNRGAEFRKMMSEQTHDSLLFSQFISEEIKNLKAWYEQNKTNPQLLNLREEQFRKIQERFNINVAKKMKTDQYKWFMTHKLNNAFLLLLGLYNSDFSDLEKLANQEGRDFHKVFKKLKSLEDSEKPEEQLKTML